MAALWKSIKISILLLILFPVGKNSLRATRHFKEHHDDIEWDLVQLAVLSPSKVILNKHRGKERYTFIRHMQKRVVEVHAKVDTEGTIWIINAFEDKR